MNLIPFILILCLASPAYADLNCFIDGNQVKCEHTEPIHTDDRKGIGMVIVRWVVYPLIQASVEELTKYIAEKYLAETGKEPGKINLKGATK